MGRRKSLLKKAGALGLAVALAVSPMSVMAEEMSGMEAQQSEETADGEALEDGQESQSGQDGLEVSSGVSSEENIRTDIQEQDKLTQNKESADDQNSGDEADLPDDQNKQKETDGVRKSVDEGVNALADGQFDTTAPVIEGVTFDQNGQTLDYTEDVKITVQAYDVDSGIKEVGAYLMFDDDADFTGDHAVYSVTFEKAGDNSYTGTYSLENVDYTNGAFYQIWAVDQNGNRTDYDTMDEQLNYKYNFGINPKPIGEITISNLTADKESGGTLKDGEWVQFTFDLKMEDESILESGLIYLKFRHESGEETAFSAWQDAQTGKYVVNFQNYSWITPGSWTLESAYYQKTYDSDKETPVTIVNMPSFSYVLEGQEDSTAPVIDSIKLDKQGQMLTAGETVNIEMKASDDVALNTDSAYIEIRPIGNIEISDSMIMLGWDESEQVFQGSFEVTEDTYPTEWYVSYASVNDSAGNFAEGYTWYDDSPYYFQVRNGNTFVNPTYTVNASFMALDENGRWTTVDSKTAENAERRSTYSEVGITAPEAPEYPGLTFQGWSTYYGEEFDPDTEITGAMYEVYYAVYDKAPVSVSYVYFDSEGYRVYDTEVSLVSKDTAVKDALTGKTEKQEPDETFPGLNFTGWDWDHSYDENAPVGDRLDVYAWASYDKAIVRFLAHDVFKAPENLTRLPEEREMEMVYCVAVDRDSKVKIPTKGTWVVNIMPEETEAGEITAFDAERTIYGYLGEGGSAVVPEDPDEPAVTPPGVTMPDEEIDSLVEAVQSVPEGGGLTVDMGNATVVSHEVLEAAKGKDVTIELNMGDYTWTLNGKDIVAQNLKDINLEVKLHTDGIPSKTVQELAGDDPAMQISLTHEGSFGFQATLTINAGREYAGKYGNLYWYDSNERMVFVDAGVIQPNGEISLVFSHASDYVLVMSDQADGEVQPGAGKPSADGNGGSDNENDTKQENVSVETRPSKMSDTDKVQNIQRDSAGSVKTGDDASVILPLILCIISATIAGAVVFGRRKSR